MKKPSGWKRKAMQFRNELEAVPVKIVADAAIHIRNVAGGKLIPLVILDTTERSDIEEYSRVHENYRGGDVISTWGFGNDRQTVALRLQVLRPVEISILLHFNIYKQTSFINQILQTSALYVQPGRPGDRLSQNPNRSKILIEIPDTGFRKHWEKERHKIFFKRFRETGLNRTQAKLATEDIIKSLDSFGSFPIQQSN